MLPGFRSVARERFRVDLLRVVEVVQGLREEVHGVVDQGRLGLEMLYVHVLVHSMVVLNIKSFVVLHLIFTMFGYNRCSWCQITFSCPIFHVYDEISKCNHQMFMIEINFYLLLMKKWQTQIILHYMVMIQINLKLMLLKKWWTQIILHYIIMIKINLYLTYIQCLW